MNALVTGGSGFLGSALVRRLVAEGVRVRAVSRRAESDGFLRDLGAEVVRCDLSAPMDGAALLDAGDVVFHAAAYVELAGRWDSFERGTIDTTRHLLDAVLPRHPSRVVYAGSGAVYPQSASGPLSASRTASSPDSYNFYGRAKLAAENLIRERCGQTGVSWSIVRMPFLYGPGNETTVRRMVLPLRRGRAFIIGRGDNRVATIYVDDAVDALWRAAREPLASGKVYDIASDELVTQTRFVVETARALRCPPPTKRISRRLASTLVRFFEWQAVRRGRTPKYSRTLVTLMSADQVVDSSRIREELGWRPRVSFAEGMRRFADWVASRSLDGLPANDSARVPARAKGAS